MNSTDKEPRLERDETDRSLELERAKTDDEFSKRASSLVQRAADVVRVARAQADEVLDVARDKADAVAGAPEQHGVADVITTRSAEDEALAASRAAADALLRQERIEHDNALTRLLALEREETNDKLLAERARADRAIASRDDFLAMVSHEARNLLSGIALSAWSLSKAPDGAEQGRTLGEAQRILRLTAQMTRLVTDLLDVSSIEAGKLRFVVSKSDATKLLNETMESFQVAAKNKAIALVLDASSEPSMSASFDHERMLQVLANLVGNALKFTPAGGTITLRLRHIEGGLQFAVSDTGVGIPAAQRELIFERYWTSPGRFNRAGLGLGLYISRGIVESHGGKIWAESAASHGTSVCFTLPDVPTPLGAG